MSNPGVLVIAEAGVNHNGSLDRALQLVDAAAAAGADIVKFQTFRAEKLASSRAPKAAYQARETGAAESQLDMLRALELSEEAHRTLLAHCAARGIEFLSTPFDEESLAFLAGLGVRRLKLGSGEVTNAPLLLAAARTRKPLILSTGMATLAEIECALGVLAYAAGEQEGGNAAAPSRRAFAAAWADPTMRALVARDTTLLQCTTEYPAPPETANLRVMATLRTSFGLPVGFSDHTQGIAVSIAATALGAAVIEKHFTLDRSLPGPDHKASLEPEELAALVAGIREVERALGDGVKVPAAVELANRRVARKSLVAAAEIRKGDVFTPSNLALKRPGDGRSPFLYWETLGTTADRDYEADEVIE